MPAHAQLLQDLRSAVAADPALLASVLPALADSATAFVDRTREATDNKMSFALIAAISLMPKLNPQSATHRNTARLIVEYGKVSKGRGSEVERRLCAFVEAADAAFPEEAVEHYHTLRGR